MQQALILLWIPRVTWRSTTILVRVIDDDAVDDARDASAELLALVAHLLL